MIMEQSYPAGTGRWDNVANLVEMRSLRSIRLNFNVVPTSSARWVAFYTKHIFKTISEKPRL